MQFNSVVFLKFFAAFLLLYHLVRGHRGARNWLVVVEVRSHKQGGLLPRQTISREKVRRLRRLAQMIWKQPRFQKLSVRIDLVEVETDAQDRPGRVEIIEHLR